LGYDEYKANISGINIFFGAIIGVVMAELSLQSPVTYSLLLILVASFIILVLYISASKHRLYYFFFSASTLLLTWIKASNNDEFYGIDTVWLEHRLLPTLSVWLFMVTTIEFLPKETPKPENGESEIRD